MTRSALTRIITSMLSINGENMEQRRVKPGDTFLTTAQVLERFPGRSPSWYWRALKANILPKPVYIGAAPMTIARELDEFLEKCAQQDMKKRTEAATAAMRGKREKRAA